MPNTNAATAPDRDDLLEAFTKGYIECALWCGVMTYRHNDNCPCHEASDNGDPYDSDDCTCDEPDLTSDGDGYDESQLTDDTRKQLESDAADFYASNGADLLASTLDMRRCGHDFWLTRNRHGAGFWGEKSRGATADAALDRLTEASHAYGDAALVLNTNGKIGDL